MIKRLFDIVVSLLGLILLAPLFVVVSILIKIDSPGPVFFRQIRVGMHGKLFSIHKFRSMFFNSEHRGLQITVGSDLRITKVGSYLRRMKIDEIPQLLDVLVGNMSFVGPRPEVPSYVSLYPSKTRDIVLSVRPGITDYSSIKFRNESDILSCSVNPSEAYVNEILPIKLSLAVEYVQSRSFVGDMICLGKTLFVLLKF